MSFETDLENYLKGDHFQEAAELMGKNINALENVIKKNPDILMYKSNDANDFFIHFLIRDFRKKDLVIKIIEHYKNNDKLDTLAKILQKNNQCGESALTFSGELYYSIVSAIGSSLILQNAGPPSSRPHNPTTLTPNTHHSDNSRG